MTAIINKNPESFWHFVYGIKHSWTATTIVSNAVSIGESPLGFNPSCTKANSCIYTHFTFFRRLQLHSTLYYTQEKKEELNTSLWLTSQWYHSIDVVNSKICIIRYRCIDFIIWVTDTLLFEKYWSDLGKFANTLAMNYVCLWNVSKFSHFFENEAEHIQTLFFFHLSESVPIIVWTLCTRDNEGSVRYSADNWCLRDSEGRHQNPLSICYTNTRLIQDYTLCRSKTILLYLTKH